MKKLILLSLASLTLSLAASAASLPSGSCALRLHEKADSLVTIDFLSPHPKEIYQDVTFEKCIDNARIALTKSWTEKYCIDWETLEREDPVCVERDQNGYCIDWRHIMSPKPVCVSESETHYEVKKVDYSFVSSTEKITGAIKNP